VLARFPGRRHAQFVFQLQNNSLSRLFPKAADFRKRRDIGVHNRGFEIVHAHSAEDGERQLRTNSAHIIDEQSKRSRSAAVMKP